MANVRWFRNPKLGFEFSGQKRAHKKKPGSGNSQLGPRMCKYSDSDAEFQESYPELTEFGGQILCIAGREIQ